MRLPMRLLYVEDDRLNALLFQAALRHRPQWELRIAEDGAEALAACSADWRPDLLVLDAHLPDTTGIELLGALRALPGLARVPAYMCSADAMPDDVARALGAGFDGYWTKPVDFEVVLGDLDRVAGAADSAPRP
jgi:CheY-like chemotaxis protein